MIRITALVLLVVAMGVRAEGQQPDLSVQEVSQQLRSSSLPVRVKAADQAWRIVTEGRSRELLLRSDFQTALLDVLRGENAAYERSFQDGRNLGEGWSEYHSRLVELSMSTVPLLSPEQQRQWLRVLTRGAYNPDSRFAVWLAGYGDLVLEALIDLTKSAAIEPHRDNAYALLAEMVGLSAFTPVAARPSAISLSFANRQRALKAVDEGLHHPESSVPREIVITLGRHASPEILTILQDFARQSRGQPSYTQRGEHYSSLQAEVEKAIAKVQTGLGQNRR